MGFNLIHKADLINILTGLIITNRLSGTTTDYQTGFAAGIIAVAASIDKQDELQAKVRRLQSDNTH